jgi:hypothetical protein
MSAASPPPDDVDRVAPVRVLAPGMRALLWVAGVLVVLAGVQLFVYPERTATYFAWTIHPPLTAAFLGAAYWSAAALEWSAARRRTWAEARIAVPAVLVFTVLTLLATLLDLERFHFGSSFEAGTQAVTWAWLAIYTVVPVLMVVLWVRQRSAPGGDPPRQHRLPAALKALVAVQAVLMVVVGVALFVAPNQTKDLWPWPLTGLTARAIGAWATSLGLAAVHVLIENDTRRVRPAAIAFVLFGGLELLSVARYPGTGDWSSPAGVVYLLFLVSAVVGGAAALWLGRADSASAEDQHPVEAAVRDS